MRPAAWPLLAALLLLPALAAAQTYRCVGKDGKKYYGQSLPMECVGLPVEMLNAQGMVVKRFDAQASAAERAKKLEDEEEAKKRAAISKEEGRRNRALLATYTSEADIDNARARALKENEASLKDTERRISGLKQKKADPQTEFEIKAQEQLLAAKQREVAIINARYDDDRKRYRELTGLDMRERASKMGEAKSVTIINKTDSKASAARDQREAEARARHDQYELQRLEAERSRGQRFPTIGGQDRSGGSSTRRTIMCGGTMIVCEPRDTVMCGGRPVACQ